MISQTVLNRTTFYDEFNEDLLVLKVHPYLYVNGTQLILLLFKVIFIARVAQSVEHQTFNLRV